MVAGMSVSLPVQTHSGLYRSNISLCNCAWEYSFDAKQTKPLMQQDPKSHLAAICRKNPLLRVVDDRNRDP